ncbi:MAG: hypothetical protein Q7R51_00725 [bacterium]|nr:hypothetical protein [bacterium]
MNKRYLFVIADRKFAKILTFLDGVLESHTEILDSSVPQDVKSNKEENYARNNKIIRHIEDHIHRHLQLISKKVDEFVGVKPVHGVFIGGHKELLHLIKKHLNPNLRKKIVGEFIAPLKVFQNKIIKLCEKAMLQFERKMA